MSARPWIVFSSSSGETFKALWRALGAGARGSCEAFFSDRSCAALAVAQELLGSRKPVFEHMRPRFEEKTLEWIHANPSPGRVILLCGFFGILSKEFLQSCGAPVVNTHPSLLPAFPGLDKGVHRQAFESVSVSGFSVHMVTEALDGGPLLFQHPVWLDPHLSFDEARDSVRAAEQKWLPRIWEKILKSDLDVADAALTSRELRARRDLDLRSFAEEIQKEVQSETPNKE